MALLPDVDDIPFLNPNYEAKDMVAGEDMVGVMGEGMIVMPDDGSTDYDGSGGGGSGFGPLDGSSGDEDDDEDGLVTDITVPGETAREEEDPMDGWFPGAEQAEAARELWEQLGCREHFYHAKPGRPEAVPEACMPLLYSISFLTFQVHIAGGVDIGHPSG